MGGNIGIGMLDLLENSFELDLAILELSSFQLKLNRIFVPDIAIWTNFYPNHLDWHGSLKEYFYAKCKVFEFQSEDNYSIFPVEFLQNSFIVNDKSLLNKLRNAKTNVCFVGDDIETILTSLKKNMFNKAIVFYTKNNCFTIGYFYNNFVESEKIIFDLELLPHTSFKRNWFFVLAALYLLNFDLKFLQNYFKKYRTTFLTYYNRNSEHRLE